MKSKSTILAGQFEHVVWIQVDGRGTFQVSAGLKEYVRRMIRRGFRQFVVDLANCEVMDSTFMGTLAGVALRLRDLGSGSIAVLNANARNQQLLENLGLDHLFDSKPPENIDPRLARASTDITTSPSAQSDQVAQRHTMLEAHEALVAASADNAPKFRDVIELLKGDAAQESTDE